VVGAVASRKIPISASVDYSASNITWKEFLDALEASDPTLVPDADGKTAASGAIANWVLTDTAVDWKARADARAHYARVDAADGPWTPPLRVRRDIDTWAYPSAQTLMTRLDPLASTVAEVQRIAQQSGRSTAGAQRAYETADSDADFSALPNTLSQVASALTTLADADRASADTPLPTAQWARDVLSVPADTASAEVALREGRADEAASLARVALDRAKLVGLVAAAAIVVPVLLLLGMGLVLLALRRRAKAKAALRRPTGQPRRPRRSHGRRWLRSSRLRRPSPSGRAPSPSRRRPRTWRNRRRSRRFLIHANPSRPTPR
jgi:hypothetical protein